ncbi:heme ABC exporter ATP-binding protein CcmA [Acidocella aminolytica]|uniref:ABC transporter cytochrome c/heme export CcmA n=1 Tax=Acidocella aminolytica 101 = DSM 11237 TaxID=1120923 RepID=A0A0D6PGI0_9PROT|nr:heme ABC exporter ATP-binding protein CcmA [Acidocella aminolytica]GAN80752.1 ABC transporter cytochrome c/heme export CcmA [Acidocella aminolytica 101 = DSM 11237]GBQ33153.1 heme exporter ATP-binding protein A [Acidocella aminolytica 101 = DSM 11237]SHF00233.1 heme exporter protein A [Acidocella aminolytica 101 = DSM 11237]
MHLLTAQKLAIFRGERLVLNGVSFALRPGGILLLRGANGAGKSSLLRALAGLTPLVSGDLFWDDLPALADREAHAARIGWLGHQDAVKPALTPAEQVPRSALTLVGLERFADLPTRFLSAGQKRRLAIARVAATPKALWLLDEPTTGLDSASIERFLALCSAQRARGGMIIASTHTPIDLPNTEVLAL